MLKLGTAHHHNLLLAGIDSLADVGCFALTELGFGNNAVEMQTTADYDAASQARPRGFMFWGRRGGLEGMGSLGAPRCAGAAPSLALLSRLSFSATF